MMDVNGKDVVVENLKRRGFERSSVAKEVYEVFKQLMMDIGLKYDVSFQGLLEAIEHPRKVTADEVQVGICGLL